jgi:hypothetical protein
MLLMRFILPFLCILAFSSIAQIPSYVPIYGLQCYYPFNGNGNDASSQNNHLTNNGAVLTSDRFGNPNSAYDFDGISAYLTKTNPSWIFNSTSTFTVSFWANRQNTATNGIAIMNSTATGGNFIWIWQANGTDMKYGTNKQGAAWIWITNPSTNNIWTHYVMVYNAGTMQLYQDNVLVGTNTFTHTGVNSANLPLWIGRGHGGNPFYGKIDDVGIWNRVLSPCEIHDLYTASNTLTTVSAGPDLYACNGGSVTLNGTGAQTYLWSPNVVNGSSFTPTINQTYTLTGFDMNNCSAWDQTNILLEQFTINAGPDVVVCQGDSAVLSATGAPNIIWNSNDVSNGIPFFPINSGYITAFATSANGCQASDSVLLTINPSPTINAGFDLALCPGDSLLLGASGASNILWNGNIANNSYITPMSSQDYIATGTDSLGCSGSDTITVSLGAFPDLDAGPDISVCYGDEITLNGTGGIFMFWGNNVVDGIPFVPLLSQSYVLTGASPEGCVGTDTVNVTVNDNIVLEIIAEAIDSYTLNGQTYTQSGTYTQILTSSTGCDSTINLYLTLDFTGLEENNTAMWSIYPNPAKDVLYLMSHTAFNDSEIIIFDSYGRQIRSAVANESTKALELLEIPNGIYFIQIGALTKRFEILR